MHDSLIQIERSSTLSLQKQIQMQLVSSILAGHLPTYARLPSSRALAKRLGVSVNTVLLAYQALTDDGYLITRPRSGHYVAPNAVNSDLGGHDETAPVDMSLRQPRVDWQQILTLRPSIQPNMDRPYNWYNYRYPFIYGQVDTQLFPIGAWRNCTYQSMNRKWINAWTEDRYTEDDPMLIEQIRQRILPRRGIHADTDEILVTVGSQNALYLIAKLLVRPDTVVTMEDPGYPDVRNIFTLFTGKIQSAPVDGQGLCVSSAWGSSIVFTTPSHQFPTNITMSLERRKALLDWASNSSSIIIEDDYEFEMNYFTPPTPSLKSLDSVGRVLYTSSLSKSLMPGIRVGFIVGERDFIKEARALRRLMLRHPPSNNQRVVALFLSLGQHDALIAKMHRVYSRRQEIMTAALQKYFPGWSTTSRFGGTSVWVNGPQWLDARLLASQAAEQGVLIEPGDICFADQRIGRHCFRLSFSTIPEERIRPGISILHRVVQQIEPSS